MSERQWHFYLMDMISFSQNVELYTQGMQQSDFETNRLVYDATLRNLELIGEAATHIPQNVKDASPTIPWRTIIATRNRLIHAYIGIDNDIIWSIIRDNIPELVLELQKIIANKEGH